MRGGSVPDPSPWPIVQSDHTADFHVFRTRVDLARSPRSGKLHQFVVLDAPDWVNVVAVTEDEQVVLVRQYRHGLRSVSLEIPGGMADPGESPEAAARRELLEETGYGSDHWERLGLVHPNPAIQNNSLTTFLARGSRRIAEPTPDGTEDIVVELVPVAELATLVSTGRITHALVVNALYWFLFEHSRRTEP
jgi:ADP-ribose diphosphatase